jgi:uncharacterized protein GlcG (DUF336 family)
MIEMNNQTTLSVTGVNKSHGLKAVKWLRDRSLLSFYNAKDKSLNAFEFKHGSEWTYNALHKALEETR